MYMYMYMHMHACIRAKHSNPTRHSYGLREGACMQIKARACSKGTPWTSRKPAVYPLMVFTPLHTSKRLDSQGGALNCKNYP